MKKLGKILTVLLTMTLVLGLFSVSVLAAGAPSSPSSLAFHFSGKGTAESPFLLKTTADLQELSKLCSIDLSKYTEDEDLPLDFIFYSSAQYKLMNNVNLSGIKNWMPLTYFMGVFDGNHKIISNLKTTRGGFMVRSEGDIQNLTLKNVRITGTDYAGALALYNDGSIKNCSVTGTVNGSSTVGLLVGENEDGNIKFCTVSGTAEGSIVGGLVGLNGATINSCSADASIRSTLPRAGWLEKTPAISPALMQWETSVSILCWA